MAQIKMQYGVGGQTRPKYDIKQMIIDNSIGFVYPKIPKLLKSITITYRIITTSTMNMWVQGVDKNGTISNLYTPSDTRSGSTVTTTINTNNLTKLMFCPSTLMSSYNNVSMIIENNTTPHFTGIYRPTGSGPHQFYINTIVFNY